MGLHASGRRAGGFADSGTASVVLAIFAATIVYLSLGLLLGPAGFTAYAALEARRGEMSANLERLGSTNEDLRGELESLRSDPDRVAREARAVGYLGKGETEIVLPGKTSAAVSYDTGLVVPLVKPAGLPDQVSKMIALGVGLAFLAIGLAPRSKRQR